VSDVYVRLGYEFNIACRAFNTIGVDTSDLGPVPDSLRSILEDTLSNEPSQASLEQYLPRIRDIIVNLLQGLKKKQQRLRQRGGRESSVASVPERPTSAASSSQTTLAGTSSRTNSFRLVRESITNDVSDQKSSELPPRMSSAPAAPGTASMISERMSPQRTGSNRQLTSQSSFTMSTQESVPPPSFQYTEPPPQPTPPYEAARPTTPTEEASPTPRPRPQQADALAALQRGGELERRASRRFSAYQIQKHLGSGSASMAIIPPAQHSPIPNRGRDTRDIMNAVRARGSPVSRSQTRFGASGSPSRQSTRSDRTTETPSLQNSSIPNFPMSDEQDALDSPMIKTPEDKIGSSYISDGDINKHEDSTSHEAVGTDGQPLGSGAISIKRNVRKAAVAADTSATIASAVTKSLTLYLQYKSQVKKVVLADGYEELSIPRLQLAFIDKFAWNTHSNGIELPDIYIQDPNSGVRYELEDLVDVKDQSVLALNVDAVDDVKKHVDHGMDSLKSLIESVRTTITDQHSVLQRVSEKQQEAAKDIAKVAAAPSPPIVKAALSKGTTDRLDEVQSLRRDLAVMRQTYTSLVSDMESSMTSLRAKATNIKTAAAAASVPTFESNSGRAYVDNGKKTLSDDSEKIINRVDDLQDIVEDLRKDVVTRGVRPLPRQLETVSRDISTATSELKKLQEYIKREKPVWTKIWRTELQVVYDDQKILNVQEELAADLEDDLEKAAQTFALVEEATKQQNVETGANGTPTRTISRTLLNPVNVNTHSDVDPTKAKDGVLGEVRALQPNHESRLEAIERAEKARQKELEERKEGAFKKELNSFVDEGKLKKSGGVEEAERMRKSKDERIRKEAYERMAAKGGAMPPPSAPEAASLAQDKLADARPMTESITPTESTTVEVPQPLAPHLAIDDGLQHSDDTSRSEDLTQPYNESLPSPVDEISVQPFQTLVSALGIAQGESKIVNGHVKGTSEQATQGGNMPGDFPADD
jgi:hypothetical protein